MDHTVLPATHPNRICFYSVSIYQMVPPHLRWFRFNCSLLLIYRTWKDERLSWPGWLTCSRSFGYISGHASSASWEQDGKFIGERPTFYHYAMQLMPWLHVKYNYFKIISAFVNVHLKSFYVSMWKLALNYFKIISEAYCSSWIFSNVFSVAEIILKQFQRLK